MIICLNYNFDPPAGVNAVDLRKIRTQVRCAHSLNVVMAHFVQINAFGGYHLLLYF